MSARDNIDFEAVIFGIEVTEYDPGFGWLEWQRACAEFEREQIKNNPSALENAWADTRPHEVLVGVT